MRERVQVFVGGHSYSGYFIRETRIGYIISIDVLGGRYIACAKCQVWRWMRA